MINLDRLKGTDLLIQGFDEFLNAWIAPQSRRNPEPVVFPILEDLPPQFSRFFELEKKWPEAGLQREGTGRSLVCPPRKLNEDEPYDPGGRFPWLFGTNEEIRQVDRETNILIITNESQNTSIWVSTEELTVGRIYANFLPGIGDYGVFTVDEPADEFLVAFGFQQLASQYFLSGAMPNEEFKKAQVIYSGNYLNEEFRVHFHQAGYLWFISPSFYLCAENPSRF